MADLFFRCLNHSLCISISVLYIMGVSVILWLFVTIKIWCICPIIFEDNHYLSYIPQIGWIYGSVTEDILTGFKMHARGWRSIYCMPKLAAFKGSAPINLSDRLNQVLRWALGSVEILLSRHCPIWYGYSGRLKWLERFAYINTTIYPITSIPLLMYCTLPAVCLLTNKFIIPQVCDFFSNKI